MKNRFLLAIVMMVSLFFSVTNVSAEEKVKIQYWHIYGENESASKVIEDQVKRFNESNDKYEVEQVYIQGGYQGLMQNLQMAAAEGNVPDIVTIGWANREYYHNNFEYNDANLMIENHAEDKDFFKNKFADNVKALATTYDDNQVGFPHSVSQPIFYLNMGILNEAGVNPEDLTSWESVDKAARQIKDNTGKNGLFIYQTTDHWSQQQMVESHGSKMITDGKASFADENTVKTYELYQSLVEDGVALNMTNDQGVPAFQSGEVGIMFMTVAQRVNTIEASDFEIKGMPAVAFEGYDLVVPAGGNFLSVTSKDENKQEASMKYLEFIYQPENHAQWSLGTGYIPTTIDAAENEDIKKLVSEDTLFGSAMSTIPNLTSWATFPGNVGLEAEQILIDMRDSILGGADVKQTIEDAQEKINSLLN